MGFSSSCFLKFNSAYSIENIAVLLKRGDFNRNFTIFLIFYNFFLNAVNSRFFL